MNIIYTKLILVSVVYLACCSISSANKGHESNSCNSCNSCKERLICHKECECHSECHEKNECKEKLASPVFQGCFPDSTGNPEFATLLATSATMTVETCFTLAAENEFTYFGVQAGTRCYGGFFYGKNSATSAACTSPCGGDSNSICGGPTANSIYQVLPEAAETRPLFVGCFLDTLATRDLPTNLASPALTVESCNQLAIINHFTFFAVQNGNGCFLGNSYGRFGPAGNCNVPCPGNPTEICGGAFANSVYIAGQSS